MNNMVQKIFVAAEINKSEAKALHIRNAEDMINYVLSNDPDPGYGKAYPLSDEMAKQRADNEMNTSSEVQLFESGNGLRLSFTCLEYFEADEDGDYIGGSDYDDFAQISEEDSKKIFDFLR